LAIIERLPPSAERDSLELSLREPVHSARLQLRGWASPKVRENAEAILGLAQKLGKQHGHPRSLLVGLWGMWVNTITQGRIAESVPWAELLLTEGNQSENIDLQIDLPILGHRASACTSFYLGELDKARTERDKAVALYDPQRAARLKELTGSDVITATGVFSCQALWMLGYPEKAAQMSDQKDAVARRVGHPFDIGWALTWGAYVFDYRCEPDQLLDRVGEAARIGRKQSIPVFDAALVPVGEGLAMLRKGQIREAIPLLERGIEGWHATGGRLNLPYMKSALAEARARQGDVEASLGLLNESLDQIERPGWNERVWLPETLRLKGWVLMRQGRRAEAEEQLRASIRCAREQQARSWELRSSTTLVELLIECGEREAASETAWQLLKPIYDWFKEGLDTHDLKAARALLEDIR
jgi:tetratricopeptide (TPR) repeat protein